MTDITERSLRDLLVEIRRTTPEGGIVVSRRQDPSTWSVICPLCNNVARFDEPFFMCDTCKRAIGQVLP